MLLLPSALLAAAVAIPARSSETPAVPPDAIIHASYQSLGGEDAVRSVRLLLDGQDVTDKATIGGMHVEFRPEEALVAGSHAAEVIVTDTLGHAWSKQWSFDVLSKAPVEVPALFAGTLLVQLDPLPRRTRLASVRVGGVTQPSVQVVLRVDETEVDRTFSSPSGRFEATVDLPSGENLLQVSALRPTTGEEGDETVARIERVEDQAAAAVNPWAPVHAGPLDVDRPRLQGDIARAEMPAKLELPVAEPPAPRERGDAHPVTSRPPRAGEIARGQTPAELEIPAPEPTLPRERHQNTQPPDARGASAGEIELPRPPDDEVVILKPTDGETFRADHVTVLGRAPAGWTVSILVDDEPQGSGTANPMGHFTVPRVMLPPGEHQLIAEAESPDGHVLRSEQVLVRSGEPTRAMAKALSLTSPARTASVARDRVQRVEGTAWSGAAIEIEVNGRIAAREIADARGWFSVDVPLEGGLNLLGVEAIGEDGSSSRVSDMSVQAPAHARTRAPGLEARPGLPTRPRPGISPAVGRPTITPRSTS
jgi:hypothetical protein